MLDADDHLGVALSVVTMRGWRREAYGDETGLPWVNPSPNLRSVDEAVLYPALGLLEATNLSVGRGTDAPFERLGAPWIDGVALAAALTAEGLAGVVFAPEDFTPDADRYAGRLCHGVHVTVRDRARFEPVQTGLAIARALRRLYRREWEFAKLDRLLVHPEAMSAIDAGAPARRDRPDLPRGAGRVHDQAREVPALRRTGARARAVIAVRRASRRGLLILAQDLVTLRLHRERVPRGPLRPRSGCRCSRTPRAVAGPTNRGSSRSTGSPRRCRPSRRCAARPRW